MVSALVAAMVHGRSDSGEIKLWRVWRVWRVRRVRRVWRVWRVRRVWRVYRARDGVSHRYTPLRTARETEFRSPMARYSSSVLHSTTREGPPPPAAASTDGESCAR